MKTRSKTGWDAVIAAVRRQDTVSSAEVALKMVEANRELIARMEAKIKAKLAEVWGETGD